ncbi:hypothetical protein DM02DRAFT_175621 [Periconia macrospinosa]|uniref:Uncharacterized protein n=1 Tax=Periconia macrospinosa TaxID=97972 RepID=A0A2V1D9N6_9PLEO|nr:hypothetical protein DM02DRAFT_175621 [Periconia macrospinosa]
MSKLFCPPTCLPSLTWLPPVCTRLLETKTSPRIFCKQRPANGPVRADSQYILLNSPVMILSRRGARMLWEWNHVSHSIEIETQSPYRGCCPSSDSGSSNQIRNICSQSMCTSLRSNRRPSRCSQLSLQYLEYLDDSIQRIST